MLSRKYLIIKSSLSGPLRNQIIGPAHRYQWKFQIFLSICGIIVLLVSLTNNMISVLVTDSFPPMKFITTYNKTEAPQLNTSNDECVGFDAGDISPTVNVTSIFNCGSTKGMCRWYYPARFFHKECGVGRKYSHLLDMMEEMRLNKTLWAKMPLIILPTASMHPEMKKGHRHDDDPFPRHNLSMTHIHKTAGTSLVSAFGKLKGLGAKTYRHTVYFHGKQDAEQAKFRNASSHFLDGTVKYQSDWGQKDHTLIGIIRDPVDRFISAVGQAMGGFGSSRNGIALRLQMECIKKTPKETLRCLINTVKYNSTWIEIHFTPMALEVSFATMYKDIPVALFPFNDVPTLMYELGENPHEKKKDGSKPGYRNNMVLTNMTISDYDDEMMQDLCGIYRLDVLFLRHIGYATRCDAYITFT